jgi:HSP20 family protein
MPITDLMPWKRERDNLPVRHRQRQDPLFDFRYQVNRLFDDFFEQPLGLRPFFEESSLMEEFNPRMDISETDQEITITAELPGLEAEDIHLTQDHNTLLISGEKRAEKEETSKRFYRSERSFGTFSRSIPLPEEIDVNKIEATYKRGVLKITLPKTVAAQKITKRITVKSS